MEHYEDLTPEELASIKKIKMSDIPATGIPAEWCDSQRRVLVTDLEAGAAVTPRDR